MRSNNRSLLTSSLFKEARSGIHPVNAPKSMFWGKRQVNWLNQAHLGRSTVKALFLRQLYLILGLFNFEGSSGGLKREGA